MNTDQNEQAGLKQIRASMSEKQRRDMAEIIQKEMERRGMTNAQYSKSEVKSSAMSGLTKDQIGELYRDVGKSVQEMRVRRLEKQLTEAKGQTKLAKPSRSAMNISSLLPKRSTPVIERGAEAESGDTISRSVMMYGVISLGLLKVLMSLGILSTDPATSGTPEGRAMSADEKVAAPEVQVASVLPAPAQHFSTPGAWSAAEKELLTQLDSRRVELERRKEVLDKREEDIRAQSVALNERLAELRGLTAKLAEARTEKEARRESRLEQLANVYSVMEPAEAAQLLAKLDDAIALELLERMPEKRMGQVLGFMDKNRAVELTKLLSDKRMGD